MANGKGGPAINKLVDAVTDKAGKVIGGALGAVTSRVKSIAKGAAKKAISQVLYSPSRGGTKVSGARTTKGPARKKG